MLGETLGSYRIERAVAMGGTGRIFFARQLESGEPAALKLAGDDSAASANLRRESRLLAQLALASPQIVSWKDHDLAASPPWFAMEWIDGAPLSSYVNQLHESVRRTSGTTLGAARPPTASLFERGAAPRLEGALRVLQQVAAALAIVHDHGIVHGDLTPNNILLRPTQTPVLVDFGAAFLDRSSQQAREVLKEARADYGTRGYMAPELHASGPSDWRRDLYSLGCICWQLLTGAPPSQATPVEIERVVPQPELRQLLLELLQPDAQQRVISARDVAAALSSLCGLVTPASGVARRSPLPRTRLVGRDAVLKVIRERLDEARAGRGSALLLQGEAGIGKSRLLNETVALAQRARFEVVAASCADAGASRTASMASPLAELFLSEPGPDVPPAPAPVVRRARQLEAIFDALVERAKRAPLLVLLDDLHWADDLTWAFARSERLGRVATLPVCVVASYRSGEPGSDSTDSLDKRVWSTLDLQRLRIDDVRNVALALLGGTALPSGVERWLHEVTAGNPLHVVECLLELRTRSTSEGALPEHLFAEPAKHDVVVSLLAVLRRRLAGLSPEARKCARVAAMFGDEFSVTELIQAVSAVWPQLPIADALQELQVANVIESHGVRRCRFSHNLFAQCSLEPIAGVNEQELGRELARHCESEGWGERSGRGVGFLAMLHALGGAPGLAFPNFVEAARHARAENRATVARGQYLRAVQQFELLSPELQLEHSFMASDAHAELADLLQREARDSEADTHYERSLALAPSELDGVKRASLLRKRARGLRSRDRYETAQALLAAARSELGSSQALPGYWSEWIEVEAARFWLVYYARKPFGALLEELEPIVLEHGSSLQQSDFYQCACASLLAVTRYRGCEQSCKYAARALQALRDSEHQDRLPDAHMVAGFPLLWRGPEQWLEAIELIEQAERGALWMDDLTLLAQSRTYLALAHRRSGNVAQAEAAARSAYTAADRIDSAGYRGASLASLAWVCWTRDDMKGCDSAARQARRYWRGGALRHPFQAFLNVVWADALRLLEQFEQARALLAELLAPDLQVLPAELEAAIVRATSERQLGNPRAEDAALQSVTQAALLHGFV